MSDILSIGGNARRTILELSRLDQQIAQTSLRISSGLRVSTPSDNVAAFFQASDLSSQVSTLLSAQDEINRAATITGGTLAALSSVETLLQSLRSEANRALGVDTTVTGNTVANVNAVVTSTIAGADDADSFSITFDGTTTTITNDNGETFQDLADEISAISGLTATVSNGSNLVITAASGQDITISNVTNELATDLGLSSSTNGTQVADSVRSAAEAEFDTILAQIDLIVGDATFLGDNLITSSPDTLQVDFSSSSSNRLEVEGTASNSTGLGLSTVDSANTFSTNTGVQGVLDNITSAETALESTRRTIANADEILSTRLEFSQQSIAIAEGGILNLTGADLSAEQANLVALQTRRDLAAISVSTLFSGNAAVATILQSFS